MPRYIAIRTDKEQRAFILGEIEQGRLRQGWGYDAAQDLRMIRKKVQAKSQLSDLEKRAWPNRRLLDSEHDGLHPGDVIMVPNLPGQGLWIFLRVKEGGYRFEPVCPSATKGVDYGHIVPVEPVRAPDGKIGIVDPDNQLVDARLRATVRNMSRMWSIDTLATSVDALVDAIEKGVNTRKKQHKDDKAEGMFAAIKAATWQYIKTNYHATELEHLAHDVFACIYENGRVQHWGGPKEKGADLIVYTSDPMGLEFKIAVQVKRFDGVHGDTHAIQQIRLAKEHHKIDAGIIVTTATETTKEFDAELAQAEGDLGIDIRLITRDDWIELVMKHIGTARRMPHAALLELLHASKRTNDFQEETPVTNLVYDDLRRLLEVENQFLEFGVWHQNRGDREHVIRIDLPDAMNATAVSAIESRLRRMIPDASLERTNASIAVTVRGLTP